MIAHAALCSILTPDASSAAVLYYLGAVETG
jgi:hypothetical protein